MTPRQLALDLELRPALGADDFLVAPPNAEAVAFIDRYPDWSSTALCVVGASGAGKTHLAKVFMARTDARELTDADLTAGPEIATDARALVLDDAARIAGNRAAEETLFHLFNRFRERGCGILLTATEPPARWPLTLPDLASRLRTAPAPLIGMPDDALLTAVLVKLFADRQIAIDADVLEYVLPRIERSYAAARGFVADIDKLALERKRRITVPLAREILNR